MSCILLALMSFMLFYQSVNSEVNATSRCKRIREKYGTDNLYVVSAKAPNGAPLYDIGYNLAMKKSTYACRCPSGTIMNRFAFHIRNLINNTNQNVSLQCSCDDNYEALVKDFKTNYDGYPELIAYMKDETNDLFFKKPAYFQF